MTQSSFMERHGAPGGGSVCSPAGGRGGFGRAGGCGGEAEGCRSPEEPGWGTWHENRVQRARTGDVMWAFTARKEGDSASMKRTIFCGAQEGPLTGDFLRRAPGLGCLPRERWCLSWGSCTLPRFGGVTNGAHSCLWHCRSPRALFSWEQNALCLNHTLQTSSCKTGTRRSWWK